MRAKYINKEGTSGVLEYAVILSQPMQHTDGFTLLGFESWEEVNDEKLSAAVTNLSEFHITKENVGFHDKNAN